MLYIASPFFTEKQNKVLDEVERILDRYNIAYFAPRKQPGNFGTVSPEEKRRQAFDIFYRDVKHVFDATGMLAFTDGELYHREEGGVNIARDSGTAFEMGMMYSRGLSVSVMHSDRSYEAVRDFHKPPLITFSAEGFGANLMIAQASRVHLPTLSHVDLFFERAAQLIEEDPGNNPKFGWHSLISRVLSDRVLDNRLAVDAINP